MAQGTIVFLFFLSVLASFLWGINIGKNLSSNSPIQTTNPQTIISPSTILSPPLSFSSPTPSSPSSTINLSPTKKVMEKTTYTDKTCGFSFSYPRSFLQQKSKNNQSLIFSDPDDPNKALALACASSIPRPPLPAEKIEAISLGGQPALLYHDQNTEDGSPRDEVIVKHPYNNMEIIIAGFGETFRQVLSSFQFIQ